MAKKEDIQEVGKSEAGGDKSKISGNDIVATEIGTVEDLESCYPQLVSDIRDEVIKTIETCPVKEVKTNLPLLYQRIVMDIQSKSGPNLNVPGFLLEVDDPVARGTLRAYQNSKGLTDLRLPYVLPYKDKKTRTALENYILRADGCGDCKRAETGRKAMEKCK